MADYNLSLPTGNDSFLVNSPGTFDVPSYSTGPSSGGAFDVNSFLNTVFTSVPGILGGTAAIINSQNGNQYPTNPANGQPSNQGGYGYVPAQQSSGISTTTVIVLSVLALLVIVTLFLLFKKS